ncbi:hypothetical protein M409DRAFT_38137 [Zasmidium cellare ATCC 36951]|uniref:Xylanolytic transcriptional activator regulatory domain-containing protein n=1 Tax=Zasmidium cellare ATCC 36951 TaxID=1080233 RepID=A0A6A6BVG5_ZASCE|nr:uncharacterized protein M409DRAFT_38137 [Zasmidium cellare ATCC 36951]KAF2158675.1 hypothetical protein M409DRAFT_38137 [Zasmidium cellare ATCC 36951]
MHDFGIAEDQPTQSAATSQVPGFVQRSEVSGNESTAVRPSDSHELGEANSISRFGSPLPSLPPRASHESATATTRSSQRRQGKLTELEYRQIMDKLQQVKHVLPPTFSLPSRQALSRYLRGYLKGLNEHFPTLHTPTFSIARTELVTLLSMATIGAMWCFEARQADTLFFTTKSATLHQLDRYSAALDLESSTEGNDVRLHILQALLHLIVAGTWGSSRLLRQGLGLQSTAATLARELGFRERSQFERLSNSSNSVSERWHRWVQAETRRRSLLMLYSYFNVMCLAYDIPPLILSSEIRLDMPAHVSLWTAETAQEWSSLYESAGAMPRVSFQTCIASLLAPASPSLRQEGAFTPLDNYITILALLQRIFFLRQSWTARAFNVDPPADGSAAELPETSNMRTALQRWQARWERSPDSIVESPTWTGPIPFTSTALLRLAWIRLSTNLGPCRNLASRDPELIADAFFKAPKVRRSSQVTMPILQAVYALAVPVQTGVEFVARAQTVSWSVQHFLCNLECAIFLSKWLEELAVTATKDPLAPDELKLVALIRSMMRETSLFHEDDEFTRLVSESSAPSTDATRMLATAVAKVWAKIFQGTFAFSFANTIGASLRIYADRMEGATSNTT